MTLEFWIPYMIGVVAGMIAMYILISTRKEEKSK